MSVEMKLPFVSMCLSVINHVVIFIYYFYLVLFSFNYFWFVIFFPQFYVIYNLNCLFLLILILCVCVWTPMHKFILMVSSFFCALKEIVSFRVAFFLFLI